MSRPLEFSRESESTEPNAASSPRASGLGFTISAVVLVGVSFWLLCYYFFWSVTHVTVELDADKAGYFQIYFAKKGQAYAERNSTGIPFQRGRASYHLSFRLVGKPDRLRLDPDVRQTRLTIRHITVNMRGHDWFDSASPSGFSAITAIHEIRTFEPRGDQGLYIETAGVDPQLELSLAKAGTAPPATTELALLLLGTILLAALTAWITSHRRNVASYRVIYAVTFGLVLLLATWGSGYFPQRNVIVAILANGIIALWTTITILRVDFRSFIDTVVTKPRQSAFVGVFLAVILIMGMLQLNVVQDTGSALAYHNASAKGSDSSLWSRIAAIPKVLENHYETYLAKKDYWVYLNSLTKIFVLGISPSPKALVGEDGFYYEGHGERRVEDDVVQSFDNVADYMGLIPFTQHELEQWRLTLEERQHWLAQRGIKYIFVLAPTKGLIYPEHLPSKIREVRDDLQRPSRYDQLASYLKNHSSVPVVDLKTPLLAAKSRRDYPLLFYKTDFHWNYYGSFIAYQAIVDGIADAFPEYELKPLKFDDFTLTIDKDWVHSRFLRLLGLMPDRHRGEHYIKFVPKPDNILSQGADIPPDGIYDVPRPRRTLTAADGRSIQVDMILNPRGQLSSIVVLGDSFIEKTLHFLSAHSKKTIHIRAVFQFPTNIYEFEKPDIVIQEVLNMYVLRDPPVNPPYIRQAYKEARGATQPQ